MNEELKELYKKFLNYLKENREAEGKAVLEKILDFEITLFQIHFGSGNHLRELVILGMVSGLADVLSTGMDADELSVRDEVARIVKESFYVEEKNAE